MASARKRGKTFTALYRDADDRQHSAGTFATKRGSAEGGQARRGGRRTSEDRGRVPGPGARQGHRRKLRDGMAGQPSHGPSHPEVVYPGAQEAHHPGRRRACLADVTAADIRVLFRHMERDGASRGLLAKVKTVLSSMLQTAAGYADNVRGLPLG